MYFALPPSPPVIGSSGNDTVTAGTGDDTLDAGTGGTDTLIGGTGINTYIVDHTGVTITKNAQDVTPAATATKNTAVFDDAISQRIAKFYLAYYGRAADYDGLVYWKDTLANQLGNSQLNMASYFGNTSQTEYVALYGTAPTDTQFLDTVYQNLFGRPIDNAGKTYWLGEITRMIGAGKTSDAAHAEALIYILDGAQGSDLTLLDAKAMANSAMSKAITTYDTSGSYASATNTTAFTTARAWTQAQQSGVSAPSIVAAYQGSLVLGHTVGDEVQASVSFTLPSNVKNLKLTGSSDLQGVGNTMDNLITANSGTDTLTGGTGADAFIFVNAPSAAHVSTITDYVHGTDAIILGHTAYTALSLGAVSVVQGSSATTTSATVLYNTTTGTLSYDADGTGAQAAVAIATLTGKPALTTGDVWVV